MKIKNITKEPIEAREEDTEDAILEQARKRAVIGYNYHLDNMNRAEENLRFIFGEQYTEEELNAFAEDNRIALTFNKLPQYINKVTGAQRSSVNSIKVTTTGASIAQEEPTLTTGKGKQLTVAQIQSDLIRDIEYQSNAIAWYKMAFKHALEGGFGWLRVLTQYQEDGFDLDIRIKGLRDRWSVIIDPRANEPDRSDMNWAFISERMPLEEFEKRYPNSSKEELMTTINSRSDTFWGDEATVTVSEYFRREPYKKTLVLLSNGEVHDKADIEKEIDELKANGITILKEREQLAYKVIWSKINAAEVLEKEREFPTTTIPVVPVLGREIDFRTEKFTKGLIDDAVDAQKAANRMKSAALERIDSSPLSPWIATDKAIEGHEQMWAEANKTNYSTLVYKKGEPRPERSQGATMPVAELQLSNTLDHDMQGSIGIFDASLGETSNEISGKAIKARQSQADVGTYEFIDNYKNAIRRIGILCTELIPKIYDTQRIVRIRGLDDSVDTVELNKQVQNQQTGKTEVINDLSFGKYSVIVSSGVSYETKKEENADKILELMRVSPQVAQVGADLLVKNLDFADSEVLADRLTKMIPPNLLSKEKQEELAKEQPQQQGPTPEQQAQQAEIEAKKMELESKKIENDAKVQIEKTRLETALVNKEIKELELKSKELDSKQKIQAEEEAKRDQIAKQIAASIK